MKNKVTLDYQVEFNTEHILEMLGNLINQNQDNPKKIIDETIETIFDSLIGQIAVNREQEVAKIILNSIRRCEEQFEIKNKLKANYE